MDKRAQSGAEYLLTYGWALILIATIVAAIGFLLSEPTGANFSSSSPMVLRVESGTLNDYKVSVVLSNATGGYIRIVSFELDGEVFADGGNSPGMETSKLNGKDRTEISATHPLEIVAGGNLNLTGITYVGGSPGYITISYTDFMDPETVLIVNVKGEIVQPR